MVSLDIKKLGRIGAFDVSLVFLISRCNELMILTEKLVLKKKFYRFDKGARQNPKT